MFKWLRMVSLPFIAMVLLAMSISGCASHNLESDSNKAPKIIDIQGHRGARGLYPENTITGFIEAVKLGVTTLEMDVVVSMDSALVVSHEPWMNDLFCMDPSGQLLGKNSKQQYNLYKMNYAEIVQFDCGKLGNAKFPFQKHLPEHKPLLSEVISTVERYIQTNKLPKVNFNIETKSEPAGDGIYNPDPKTFVRLLYDMLNHHQILQQTIVQSFDVRTLQEMKKTDASIRTALLVENVDGLNANLDKLGFLPTIYSPDFNLVNEELIAEVHKRQIKIIPWTVNRTKDMKTLVDAGVDGFITDYPDSAVFLKGTFTNY